MSIEIETRGVEVESGWRDQDGFIVPLKPGTGPRTDPKGEFPTGPDIGAPIPNVNCIDSFGKSFDLHQEIAGRPAIFVFYRSAVW